MHIVDAYQLCERRTVGGDIKGLLKRDFIIAHRGKWERVFGAVSPSVRKVKMRRFLGFFQPPRLFLM